MVDESDSEWRKGAWKQSAISRRETQCDLKPLASSARALATLGMINSDQHCSKAVAYSRYISQMALIGARVPYLKRAE